jgi:serine/threonine protein kinase
LVAKPEHSQPTEASAPSAATSHGYPAAGASDSGRHDPSQTHFPTIPGFRIIREIGRGGMGVVYEAEEERLSRQVALKILPAGALNNATQVQRFEREAKAAGRLHHTNIVPVFGVGQQDGQPFYVMQYIEGLGLHAVVNELRRLRSAEGDGRRAAVIGPVDDPHSTEPRQCREVADDDGIDAAYIARSLAAGAVAPEKPYPDGERPTDPDSDPTVVVSRPDETPNGPRPDPWSLALPGSTEKSSPFFDGRAFYQSIARIGLQVADALDYANHQGVLHRDIKPSNLLLDRKGIVWVTDFGLAKTVQSEDLTQTGQFVGTLRYMAPERFHGGFDARSDVYSLGLTLYELIALRPAHDELDPLRLIDQIKSQNPPALRRRVPRIPRDLETVIEKSTAREPGARYGTAGAMAEDLRRFLEDRPILARRASTAERVSRWCRRNPWVAGFLAVLAIGATTAGILAYAATRSARAARLAEIATRKEWGRAERETAKARQSESEARAVLDFFQNKVLAAARPKEQAGGLGVEATIRQALDTAEPSIQTTFESQPSVEATIRNALGESYYYLGAAPLAIRQHERALALRKKALGADHPDTLHSMNNLAGAYLAVGRVQDAIALHEQILKVRIASVGRDHPDTLTTRNNLADAYREAGQLSRAIELHEETLALQTSKLGPDHEDTLETRNNLGAALWSAGRLLEAIAQFQTTFKLMEAKLGRSHPITLTSRSNLAVSYMSAGRTAQAIELYETTLKLLEGEVGADHPTTLTSRNNLAVAYQDAGRFDDAIALQESTLKLMEAQQGLDHPRTLIARTNLARSYESTGQWNKAELFRRGTIERHRQAKHPDKSLLAIELTGLGRLLLNESRWSEAKPLVREALAIIEKAAPTDWRRYHAMSLLGGALAGRGRYAEAEPLILEGYDGLKDRAGKMQYRDRPLVGEAGQRLIRLYEQWGKPEEASAWKTKLGLRDLPADAIAPP